MRALTIFIILISVAASGVAHLHGERVSPSLTYWQEKLPTTPIPQLVRELISPDDDDDGKIALNVVDGGMKVDAGMRPRKVGTQGVAPVPLKRCDVAKLYAPTTQMPMDASSCTFLLEKDLVSGTKVSLTFLRERERHFLPRSVADQIPFYSDKLPLALKELNIAPDSVMALAMKETLQACERPAEEGENKFCATSLESLVDLSTSKLGSNRLNVLATNVSKIMSKSVRQEYTIVGVKDVGAAEKDVYYCHSKQYAYAVYYCHKAACTLEAGRRIARVWVKGEEDGRTLEAVAVCHKDTSAWIPNNIPFKALNVKPGTPSICIFVPQGDHLWQTSD
ncbi:hypothetical protein SUGI_0256210 [Cryptomeria japonica]|uniref:BURP domain-containing protein 6 n=1 Tax=Cryptomeria japonica TaxID=3369 RepID=UPI002408D978|nr:BURP domain-containing protein 6 [Cryptomeria japonica]GLJ15591.1 hypothetical protein SUGI_0256210 [Cryptomeria japonica]